LQSGPLQAGHGWRNTGRMGLLRHARLGCCRRTSALPLNIRLLNAWLLNTRLRTAWRRRARQRRAAGLTGQRLA
jgi:hypothetical protein